MSGPDFDLFTAAAATPATRVAPKPAGTRGKPITFAVHDGEDVRTITPRGRDAWALGELISARADGCTPITHVGPRWSHYIWKLRTVYGLAIESVEEQHGGEFAGRHVRYVLRSRVAFADPADTGRIGGDQ
jgi:hypothetical protein